MQNKKQLSIEELKNYRDMLVGNLQDQINLLDNINSDLLESENDDKELTSARVKEYKELLNGEIFKLKNFDVVLAVIGTMKAGKSTTINAIIGREIMPHRDLAMTALPTLICHTHGKKEPQITLNNPAIHNFVAKIKKLITDNPNWEEHHEIRVHQNLIDLIKHIKQGYQFTEPVRGDEAVFQFLMNLNDLVRLSKALQTVLKEDHENNKNTEYSDIGFPYDNCRNIDQLPIIEVEFSHLTKLASSEGRLILLDTAGPNEAGQEQLKAMLSEQLKRSSAVLLVLDSMQIGSEAEHELKEELNRIETNDKSRLFVLANQFDRKDSRGTNEEETKKLIFDNLLKNKVELDHIFPVSTKHAYLAYRMKTELEVSGKKPILKPQSWIEDFAKLALGSSYETKWEKQKLDDIKGEANTLITSSKIENVINKVIAKTQTEAPFIAMYSAIAQIKNTVEKTVQNFTNIHSSVSKATKPELEKIQETLEQLDRKMQDITNMQEQAGCSLKKLKEELEEKGKESIKNIEEEVKNQITDLLNYTKKKIEDDGTRIDTIIRGWVRGIRISITREAKELIKKYKQGNEFIFPNEDIRDEFCDQINKFYQEVVNAACKNAEEVIKEIKEKINKQLNTIEETCKKQSTEIKSQFNANKIEVELKVPSLRQFKKSAITPFSYSGKNITSYNKTVSIEQEGISGSFKRGAGSVFNFFFGIGDDWGYDEDTKTYYKVSTAKLKKQMESDLKKNVVHKIDHQINRILQEYSDEFINDYIGTVRNIAQRLINELKSALNQATDSKVEKEKYQQEIEDLKRRSEQIKENIQIVKNVLE